MSQKKETNASEMLRGVAEGEMPSNPQISSAIEQASEYLEKSSTETHLSGEAKRIIQDTHKVLDAAEQFVTERNAGEHLQKIIESGTKLGQESSLQGAEFEKLQAKFDPGRTKREELRREAEKGLEAARGVSLSMIKSRDFRNAMVDVIEILSDVCVQSVKENVDTEGIKKEVEKGSRKEKPAKKAAKETKKKAQEGVENMDVEISEEQKRELRDRFYLALDKLADNSDFNQATRSLFFLLEESGKYAQFWGKEAEKNVEWTLSNMYIKDIWRESQNFLEEFTGKDSLRDLTRTFKSLVRVITEDQEPKNLLNDFKNFVFEGLDDPKKLKNEEYRNRFDKFMDEGRRIYREDKYQSRLSNLFDHAKDVIEKIRDDPVITNLAESVRKLLLDVTTDRDGKPEFKPELLAELKDILVPMLLEQFKSIPLPPVIESGEVYDYIIENISFSGADIIPAAINIETASSISVGLRPVQREYFGERRVVTERPSSMVSGILVKLEGMRVFLNDLNVWYHRKSFPSVEDNCVANVDIGDKGIDITLLLEIQNPRTAPVFFLHAVDCKVHNLKVKVTESTANWLYNLLLGFFNKSLKNSIEDSVERRVTSFFFSLNEQLDKVVKATLEQKIPMAGITQGTTSKVHA